MWRRLASLFANGAFFYLEYCTYMTDHWEEKIGKRTKWQPWKFTNVEEMLTPFLPQSSRKRQYG
jgi:hypothetical protein